MSRNRRRVIVTPMLTYRRDFLSTIWPIGDFDVSGKRLSRMYRDLSEKDKKDAGEKADKPKKRDDLEDGEIDDEEEARRQARRDARREISEDVRREYRRDDYKHRAYENGDRLSFRKDRGLSDRGRQTWLSPNPRHSPY